MKFKKIVARFKKGSVCVVGLRGKGKDMLIANVVARRKGRYISNVDYTQDERYIPFVAENFDVGGNTYRNFISGKVKKYVYPYEDGVDIYLSDIGVYYPSQYCNELNKYYPQMPVMMALIRQIGDANFHFNVQNLNRAWDKMREQSELYITCLGCKVFFGKIVVQKVRFHEKAESCENRIPLYRGLPCVPFSQTWQMQRIRRNEYYVQHGKIEEHILIYVNKSKYDTRIFKRILEEGEE